MEVQKRDRRWRRPCRIRDSIVEQSRFARYVNLNLGEPESLEDLRRDDHHMYVAARSRNTTPKGLNIHILFIQNTIIFGALLDSFRLASGS